MIGLSAETTGLPPALRVPARQHLQHTLAFYLTPAGLHQLTTGDSTYAGTGTYRGI